MNLLKKLLKVAFVLFALLVVVGVGFYFTMLRPAPVASVCENLFEVSEQHLRTQIAGAAGDANPADVKLGANDIADMLKMTPDECVAKEERSRRLWTASGIKLARITKCQANAATFEEFQSCS